MRKSVKIRLACLIMAGIMLTGSLVFAAVNGSPYEILKDAVFNAMFLENFTMDVELTGTLNGEFQAQPRMRLTVDETATLEEDFESNGEIFFSYRGSELALGQVSFFNQQTRQSELTEWYRASLIPPSSSRPTSISGDFGISPADRQTATFRFMELLLDLAVGDLKNNITMTTNDGIRNIQAVLTHSQLPEIFRVGLEVIIEENLRWADLDATREDFFDPLAAPMTDIYINRIQGNARVDADGNLLFASLDAELTITNIFGDVNAVGLFIEANFSDIGTTVVQSPILGANELFTPEFFARTSPFQRGTTLSFTLNPDGTINEESITTSWPLTN